MKPVVPTTQWIPLAMHVFRVRITASGVVKSTMTSEPASRSAVGGTPMSTAATRCRSSASFTASTTD